jgi:serine/threonine-protein kinase
VAGSKPKSPSNRRSVSGPGEDAGSLMGAFDSWLGEGKEARREPPATEETLGILSPEKGDEQEGEVIPLEVEEPVEPQEIPLELEPEPSPGFRSESEVVELEAVTEDPRIGTVIGGCRIEERIGRDALSVIYRATQLSVARPVELRVLAEPLARDAAAVQRFLAAACAGGRLTHPHILQVYDAGGANSLYYVALEAMDGLTVRQLLKQRGSLPVETVLEIGIQIASALAHAHAQGICHGSIGLGNILVTRHGIAKLAELGFTQGLEDAGRRAGRGVSQFTAPEQLQFPHVTEPPADIYALGAVLFVLFSGRFPFRGRTEGELEQKIVSGRHESLQQLQPSLPAELCKVVERAMSPRPADRRPDAAALQQELTAIRDGLH